MKIDDPAVQAYIKGEMSPEQEVDFRQELSGHPEVADLVETLKKTAAFIEKDQVTGEKPYGLDLTKKTAQKLFEDDEVPDAAWARFFHKAMGKSWRFGVIILGATFVIFVFAFLVVPFIRSLQDSVESPQSPASLKELKIAAKKNRSSSGSLQNRSIPTHTTKNKKVSKDIAEAFTRALDPSALVVSSEAVQALSDLAKVSSTAGSATTPGTYQLPTAFETELQQSVKAKIVADKTWSQQAVQVDAFANSYFQMKSSNVSDQLEVRAEWRTSPWNNKEVLLMLDVQAPRGDQKLSPKQVKIGLLMESKSSLRASLAQQFGENTSTMDLSSNFSERLSQQLEEASLAGQKFVLVADGTLTRDQADFFILAISRFPHLKFSFISLVPNINENHLKVRSGLRLQKTGEYYSAATPSQLLRSLEATLKRSDQVFQDFRWNIEFNKKYISNSRWVGQIETEVQRESIVPSHWLMSNDRTVAFFLLKLNEVSPQSKIGNVRVFWRRKGEPRTQSLERPLIRRNASILMPESTYQFAAAVIHVGLMLKGDLTMNKPSLQSIESLVSRLEIEPRLVGQKTEFLKLVATLLEL